MTYIIKEIKDLTGIRYFTALKTLNCGSNNITALDVSGCTALETLLCEQSKNGITKLDVSGCTSLKTLQCTHSFLSSLDASGCASLETLQCADNRLTSLDVSGCTSLSTLYCYSNQLTSLDVSDCAALRNLQCYNNQLTALDVSGCANLEELDCSSNTSLTSLDASGCTALETLYCANSRLTSLNVSGCTALDTLNCNDNSLTSLDVSGNTALHKLGCVGNQLTSLDVSQNTKLSTLSCSDNQLTSLDVTKNEKMDWLICRDQNVLLEVERRPDDTWSADLAERVAGWKEHFENIEANPAEVWDETTDTVAWSKGTVWPTVTYDFDTEFTDTFEDPPLRIKMNVTLTLAPLGVGTEADVTRTVVKNIAGVISGTEITVQLPAGSPLPTAGDIAVTLSPYATMTNLTTTDDGRTWTFTVTSEDGKTKKNYTLYIVYGVTVESGEDGHGTVTASPNPARMGDTVTLTVTPDPGYMLTGWEVVLGDVTVGEDNTFVMPAGGVILRPIFAPIPTPPQTGDDSHTGLWLTLLLVSLGGLCAAAYAVRRRRSGGAR